MRVHEEWGTRLNPMNPRVSKVDQSFEQFHIPEKKLLPLLNRGIGIEIEMENVPHVPVVEGWTSVKDGSLRNSGIEYITRYGCRLYQVPTLLKTLRRALNEEQREPQFSARTSVHVHLDVRYFPIRQLEAVLILYTVFEDALFQLSGNRQSNVFCVPIRYSAYLNDPRPGGMERLLRNTMEDADKYSAVNLCAVRDKGTIEFRHMEGNLDGDRIWKWCLLLGLLLQHARSVNLKVLHQQIMNVKGSSHYDLLKQEVFHGMHKELPTDTHRLDESLSDAKAFFNFSGEA